MHNGFMGAENWQWIGMQYCEVRVIRNRNLAAASKYRHTVKMPLPPCPSGNLSTATSNSLIHNMHYTTVA